MVVLVLLVVLVLVVLLLLLLMLLMLLVLLMTPSFLVIPILSGTAWPCTCKQSLINALPTGPHHLTNSRQQKKKRLKYTFIPTKATFCALFSRTRVTQKTQNFLVHFCFPVVAQRKTVTSIGQETPP